MDDKKEVNKKEKAPHVKIKKMIKAKLIKNLDEKDIKVSTAKKSKLGINVECPSCLEKVDKTTLKLCDSCGQQACLKCLIKGKYKELLCMSCIKE
ncbi:hypothetical protein SYNTR_1973 [Candidatus Syntrophocurvum alkaliphilum]|uniref:Uncharacterized protein n=1 Tax=Candidatus Syntrophocurvum alkaliphilum TaxID=2293317 RepID=A0A6I6DKZ9_9FIRM|nr:hypothetical protein [Candidatus Syntrophocurvum alkaliphilum]QGU00567.1 hypothetical protein SYNTR_1973 [Candidatus Syntrophocurvum alkaliphilum]